MIGASKWSRVAFAVWAALIMLFLFVPIAIIVVYAFNPSNVQSWPLPGLSTKWFSSTWHNAEMRHAFWLSVRAGLISTAIALTLTLPIWIFGNIRLGQQFPQVNVVVLFVILLSLILVALARRLTRDTGVLRSAATVASAGA